MATTYTVTSSFAADTTALASEVNQNFTDVLTALNSFDAANLTGTIALARISDLTATQMASTFFLDEDAMTSNSATAVSSQQAIKAYVTAQIAAQGDTRYARGWVLVDTDGTDLASFNVTSVTRSSTGTYVITWNTDFGSANYAVALSNYPAPGEVAIAVVDAQAAGTITISTYKGFETAIKADVKFSLVAFGAQ